MAHHHHHDHHHHLPDPAQMGRAFGWGILLNAAFVGVEITMGLLVSSLALLTDAGHNLSDVFSLILSWAALHLSKFAGSRRFTYGYRKFTIWASLLNGLMLLAAVMCIGLEAFSRLNDPPEVPGLTVSGIAVLGIAINAFSAWLFHRGARHDLNIRGAYLHLVADAAVSAGVVAGGLLMHWTGWWWIDPVVGFLILLVILLGVWSLLRESICLALDGVPRNVDMDAIEAAARDTPGVLGVHHLHVWAMSTSENALTAHLVLADDHSPEAASKAKDHLRHRLLHLHIRHVTLETETKSAGCATPEC
ncbi:MAG: cation diffusion facilitator family transporter [Saprospiraceae bacterium]|nr:cation diffusion facilitator family transporter [Saprospiraceae bacterium]